MTIPTFFFIVASAVLSATMPVWATNESQNIALVPNAGGRFDNGGALPTTGFPDGYAPTFTDVDPLTIGITEDLSLFDTVVLVGICDIGSTNFLGNTHWKATIDAFVFSGGKLIVWDSECQNTDYSKFLLPFSTNNPGAQGARGSLGITEENSLSRTSVFSPRYIDVAAISSGTDAVGDANVFISNDPRWCVDMRAINIGIGPPPRPTHTYAGRKTLQSDGLGDGLIIYNGLDKDAISTTGLGGVNLGRIWLFELLQPFNPDNLPCSVISTCGNGILDPSEKCDPAALSVGCAADENCDVNNCVCVNKPTCGDGFSDSPEECDPNMVPTGCVNPLLPVCNAITCKCEFPTCGNNLIEAGEECDGTNDSACPGLCVSPGTQNECQCPVCGDDAINQISEECDGIDQAACNGVGCNPPGHLHECRCVSLCGDGTLDADEECDDGDIFDGDGCSADCKFESLDCEAAAASIDELWPPNHKFVPVSIQNVVDYDGNSAEIEILSIYQDEPTNTKGDGTTCPDASGVGSLVSYLRAERSGTKKVPGDGRVYHIEFLAADGKGRFCTGEVTVCVPHDQSGRKCVDQGHLYDSTVCT